MKSILACPDHRDLERLLLGQLSDEELLVMESHLAGCQHCGDTLPQVCASDTLTDAIHAQARAAPPVEPEIVHGIIERLSALPATSNALDDLARWKDMLAPPQQDDEL